MADVYLSTKHICVGILAGGLSRRMGGNEKSLMLLDGHSLIERVYNRTQHVDNTPDLTLINANGDPKRFKNIQVPIVSDAIEGFAGPLAGIHAMMAWLRKEAPQITHLASCAADTPFFPIDYFTRMAGQSNANPEAIIMASSGGHHHPVFAIWPIAYFDALDQFLREGETRKVMAFVQRFENIVVDFSPDNDETSALDPFFNINTPEELELAQRYFDNRQENS